MSGTATLVGLVTGESLTVSGTANGTLSSANAGTRSVTTAVSIADNGAYLASNYSVTQPTLADVTISQRPITVAAVDQSRTYGNANPATGAVTVTAGSLVGADALGSATVTAQATATATANAGTTHTLTPGNQSFSVGAASNYLISYTAGKLTITPAPLTVSASNASKVYGQTPTLTAFTSSGLKNGETIGRVTEISAGSAGTASVASSPYTVTPSAATGGTFNAGNYTISYVNGSLTVTPAPLTVTASNANKTYDGQAYSGGNGVTYSGFVNNETKSVLGGTLGFAGSAQGATNAGSFTITPQGLTAGNYILSFADGNLTIGKAHLTVTAADANRVAGQANPVFTATLSGLVNNETPTSAGASGSAALSTRATASSAAGTFTITVAQGSLAARNYDFTVLKDGTLTIKEQFVPPPPAAPSPNLPPVGGSAGGGKKDESPKSDAPKDGGKDDGKKDDAPKSDAPKDDGGKKDDASKDSGKKDESPKSDAPKDGIDTVARLGGDEFAVLLGQLESPQEAGLVAAKLVTAVAQKIDLINDGQVAVSASIGITMCPADGSELDVLLGKADAAMYQSKERGGNRFTFWDCSGLVPADDDVWIQFGPEHLVGHELMDEQHRKLVELGAQLHQSIRVGVASEVISAQLSQLLEFVQFHFTTESRLMERCRYPGKIAHDWAHARLLADAVHFETLLHRGGDVFVLRSIKEWLLKHIETEDKALGEYLSLPENAAALQ